MSEKKIVKNINGSQFARVISAGAKWLSAREKQLDDINLFPIPDADTGTNMGGTVILLAENPENYQHDAISKASKLVAEATILSAKGNSGSILAQFFQGLAEGFQNLETANIEQFSKAARIAAIRSREAVSNPVEGTILTVLDDWSNHLMSTFDESEDLAVQLKKSLIVAEKSLQHTKEQMEVLRKANVVDAGAQGFVYMLEGIVNYISHGTVQRDKWRKATEENISFQNGFDFEKSEFQFCTEALLSGDSIDRDKIRAVLEPLGDSLVVIGSNEKVRVHIHTNKPGKVYEILRTFGKIIQEKIDDMDQQKRDVLGDIQRNIALVTDTSCDVPVDLVEKYNIHRVPFGINMGGITQYDERTITNEDFYHYMLNHEDSPKTSQLSKNDLTRMFEWTNRSFQYTVMLVLARAVSASIDNATAVAKTVSSHVYAIDSKTTCVGTGLIAIEAGKAIEQGKSINEVLATIEWCKKNSYEIFTVEDLVYLMRGGRLSKGKMFLGNMLHMKPILYVEEDGSLHQYKTALGGDKGARKKTMKRICQLTQGKTDLNFGILHSMDQEKAEWYKKQIQNACSPKSIYITKLSPTLGAHSGPSTIAISWLPDFETQLKNGKVNLKEEYPEIFNNRIEDESDGKKKTKHKDKKHKKQKTSSKNSSKNSKKSR